MVKSIDFRASVLIAAALLAAVLLVVVATEKPAKAAFPGKNGLIVFTSDRDSTETAVNDRIYAMNSDGSNPIRLTTTTYPAADQYPALSPDGTKVAFVRFGDLSTSSTALSTTEIYVMNADGSGTPTQLTNNAAVDINPAWSPDGNKLVFESNRDGNEEIYMMKAEDKDGDGNGENLKRLTNNPAFDQTPAWSPDGNTIAFASTRIGGGNEVFVMDSDPDTSDDATADTSYKQLTNAPGPDIQPSFSPDGTHIAFVSTRDGDFDIWVVNADGFGTPTNLTNDMVTVPEGTTSEVPTNERWPAWSPDGTSIAFWSAVGSGLGSDGDTSEIYVMNATNGANKTNLTNNKVGDIQPDWGPEPKKTKK